MAHPPGTHLFPRGNHKDESWVLCEAWTRGASPAAPEGVAHLLSLLDVRGSSLELDLLRPLGPWLELSRLHQWPRLVPESLQGELPSFKGL